MIDFFKNICSDAWYQFFLYVVIAFCIYGALALFSFLLKLTLEKVFHVPTEKTAWTYVIMWCIAMVGCFTMDFIFGYKQIVLAVLIGVVLCSFLTILTMKTKRKTARIIYKVLDVCVIIVLVLYTVKELIGDIAAQTCGI